MLFQGKSLCTHILAQTLVVKKLDSKSSDRTVEILRDHDDSLGTRRGNDLPGSVGAKVLTEKVAQLLLKDVSRNVSGKADPQEYLSLVL
jgi:hypothetical protein